MESLSPKVKLYIATLLALTVILATAALRSLDYSPLLLMQIAIFALAICIADLYPIVLPFEGNAELTVSCAFKTAAAIIYGPYVAIIIVLTGTLLAEIMLRRVWYKMVFNAAEMTLTFAGMALAYELFYDGWRMPFHSLRNAYAVCSMLAIYFIVNTGLVATIVSLTTNTGFLFIWKTNFRALSWNDLTIIPLGAVMATLWQYRPWSVVALLLPVAVVRQSFRFIADLQRETQEALVSMADAIDRRDPSTAQHSLRVAKLSLAIAQAMNLPGEDLQTIRMGARLHDVGKIGMSNTLLYKPGRFTEEEMAEFRQHPLIGADLVKSFRLFSDGQNLIRYHHERWDGLGYPTGLTKEDIPLGSRILAVADSFDAMTSNRIYRKAMSLDEALSELERNKSTQFDPDVVEAFKQAAAAWNGTLPWAVDGQPSGGC